MKRTVVALILLLTSCSPLGKQEATKALSRVTTELTAIREVTKVIEHKAPELKPEVKLIETSVSNIEKELPVIHKVVAKLDAKAKEPSKFQQFLPWVLMGGGILMLWFAIKTPDPYDDITGAIMCGSSFVVAKYFDTISLWAGVLLLLYLILIGAKYFALKGNKET